MKSFMAIVAVMCLLIMGSCAQKVNRDLEKANVKLAIDQMLKALETEDMDLISKTTAHDTDMVNFGTDATERWVGWESFQEAARKQFEVFENTKMTVMDQVIKIHDSGKVAWYSEVVDMETTAKGQPVSLKGARLTGVFEKRNGNWIAIQSHFSVPVSGQAAPY